MYICRNCGNVINSLNEMQKSKEQGLGCASLFLWFLLSVFVALFTMGLGLLIFVVVLAMDHTKAKSNGGIKRCSQCQAIDSYISTDTPVGKELYDKYYPQVDNTDNA